MTTDLAIRQHDPADLAPRFVLSLDDLKRQVQDLERFKREIMIEGEDYGVIPGTPKPTLLKPGAEKLTLVFGLAPTFVNAGKVEDWEGGFFHYEEECRLTSKRTGELVASANGSANTREPRYRWRKAERVCPNCGKSAIIKGKAEYGGGWLCWAKKDGCGSNLQDGDPEIEGQVAGNVANPEPFELVNTVKKMAQKRALVAATLIATGGSGIWTQDVEDMPSVSGDGPVIEGQARTVTTVEPHNGKGAAPPADMVTSADDRMWKRWLELSGEAIGLGLRVQNLRLPIGKAMLSSEGQKLSAAILARMDGLAEDDAERKARPAAPPSQQGARPPAGGPTPAEPAGTTADEADLSDAPESATDAALQRNAELQATARELGVKGLGQFKADAAWSAQKVDRANEELSARIASRNSDLDASLTAGQTQAF